jgi:hypothetical protein
MSWVSQPLTGTVDGVNQTFTIAFVPDPASLIVVFTGVNLEMVGSSPGQMQFAFVVSGTTIILGLAPQVGQTPWALYWKTP